MEVAEGVIEPAVTTTVSGPGEEVPANKKVLLVTVLGCTIVHCTVLYSTLLCCPVIIYAL